MSEEFEKTTASILADREQAMKLMDKLVSVAQPGTVFGAPVTSGEYTVITASEVGVGLGFGFGMGGGKGLQTPEAPTVEKPEQAEGFGGGVGGGGGAGARPIAVISIGPKGVQVGPVVDATKLGMAVFSTLGAMLMMVARVRIVQARMARRS
jgi:uncharacterized spore protein YtfJ